MFLSPQLIIIMVWSGWINMFTQTMDDGQVESITNTNNVVMNIDIVTQPHYQTIDWFSPVSSVISSLILYFIIFPYTTLFLSSFGWINSIIFYLILDKQSKKLSRKMVPDVDDDDLDIIGFVVNKN